MHYLASVMEEVDKTHPHLGNPVAVAMLAIKAKKLLLIVSPRGCGKSRITSFTGLSYPEHSLQDRLSVAGLQYIKEEFNGFQGVLVVDDIAKTQTSYARITTLTTLAELVYSHYCVSRLSGSSYEIKDFYGSALVNIQPVLLREIVRSDEWEASMQDKSIRYYHLFRPQEPNPYPPELRLEWGFAFKQVEDFKPEGQLAEQLFRIGEIQWGLARLREHMTDLLKASAALDKRYEVTEDDYTLLLQLLRPLQIEALVMTKRELEAERRLNSDELAILTEFITYGNFSLEQLSRDYKLSQSQCYRIMAKYTKDWVQVERSPCVYAPSKELKKQLGRLGL